MRRGIEFAFITLLAAFNADARIEGRRSQEEDAAECKVPPSWVVTWDAGYGECHTYGENQQNHKWCKGDYNGGLSAAQVCPECGLCGSQCADNSFWGDAATGKSCATMSTSLHHGLQHCKSSLCSDPAIQAECPRACGVCTPTAACQGELIYELCASCQVFSGESAPTPACCAGCHIGCVCPDDKPYRKPNTNECFADRIPTTCSSFVCESTHQRQADFSTINCPGGPGGCNEGLCCESRTCRDFVCDSTHQLRANPSTINCPGGVCNACCEPALWLYGDTGADCPEGYQVIQSEEACRVAAYLIGMSGTMDSQFSEDNASPEFMEKCWYYIDGNTDERIARFNSASTGTTTRGGYGRICILAQLPWLYGDTGADCPQGYQVIQSKEACRVAAVSLGMGGTMDSQFSEDNASSGFMEKCYYINGNTNERIARFNSASTGTTTRGGSGRICNLARRAAEEMEKKEDDDRAFAEKKKAEKRYQF